LPDLRYEFLFNERRIPFGAAEGARQRTANLNMMAADWLHVEHGVKAHHTMHPAPGVCSINVATYSIASGPKWPNPLAPGKAPEHGRFFFG